MVKAIAPLTNVERYNLEQWVSEDGIPRKTHTHLYDVMYPMCSGLKARLETQRQLPGTFFKIVKNIKPS
jgi:hypothetical protein